MINPKELRKRLADPATRTQAAIEFGDWARDLCLMMDSELKTALYVGALMASGLERDWSKDE